MATINATVSVEVVDAYGISGEVFVNVTIPDTATLAQVASDVAALVALITPLTSGVQPKAITRLVLPGDGLDPATALGDIEKGGLFNFSNATDSYKYGELVPDINPGVLNSSGLIDLTNTDVTNFVTWMTTAHTALTPVTKGNRALTALADALITFRKHRKPLSRKTKEL